MNIYEIIASCLIAFPFHYAINAFMPELPEVETVRKGLEPYLVGHRVKQIKLNRPDLRFPIPVDIPRRAQGQKIIRLARHGKGLFWHFDTDLVLAWHLGMSGSFRAHHEKMKDKRAHDHIDIFTEEGAHIIYNDPRRFGYLIYPSPRVGIDPFDERYTLSAFSALLRNKQTPIKSALLDQTLVTGIGNIYACEALFQAGIHPARPAGSLKKRELEKLFTADCHYLSILINEY